MEYLSTKRENLKVPQNSNFHCHKVQKTFVQTCLKIEGLFIINPKRLSKTKDYAELLTEEVLEIRLFNPCTCTHMPCTLLL